MLPETLFAMRFGTKIIQSVEAACVGGYFIEMDFATPWQVGNLNQVRGCPFYANCLEGANTRLCCYLVRCG